MPPKSRGAPPLGFPLNPRRSGEAVLRQGFAKHTTEEERCWGGEGCALEGGPAALPSPLYL